MIADPSIAVQRAVFAARSGDAALTGLLGSAAIFDRPPPNAALPWILIGQDHPLDDGADDLDGAKVHSDIHIFADGALSACKRIAARVVFLMSAPLDFSADGHRCLDALVEGVRYPPEPDGASWHALVEVSFLTEPTA